MPRPPLWMRQPYEEATTSSESDNPGGSLLLCGKDTFGITSKDNILKGNHQAGLLNRLLEELQVTSSLEFSPQGVAGLTCMADEGGTAASSSAATGPQRGQVLAVCPHTYFWMARRPAVCMMAPRLKSVRASSRNPPEAVCRSGIS